MPTAAGASAAWSFPARVLKAFQLLQASMEIMALPPVAASAGGFCAGFTLAMAFLTGTFFLAATFFFGGMAGWPERDDRCEPRQR